MSGYFCYELFLCKIFVEIAGFLCNPDSLPIASLQSFAFVCLLKQAWISNYCKILVEIAGFEPASKQGTNMLSTRLSWPSFSSNGKTQATNYCLIC